MEHNQPGQGDAMSHPRLRRDPEQRRDFLELALLGLAGGALVTGPPPACRAGETAAPPKLQALTPEGAPAAAPGYSPGILAEGRRALFISGQGPKDLKADMETQMRQTFDRLGLILKAAGASFKHVALLRAYFVHLKRDLPAYRKVRLGYLVKPYPASTAVGVTELAIPGLEVEIEAVAIL
jgi:enamine deaminase RidA (YjgF/YER057c/UK114 family)